MRGWRIEGGVGWWDGWMGGGGGGLYFLLKKIKKLSKNRLFCIISVL